MVAEIYEVSALIQNLKEAINFYIKSDSSDGYMRAAKIYKKDKKLKDKTTAKVTYNNIIKKNSRMHYKDGNQYEAFNYRLAAHIYENVEVIKESIISS